MKTRTVIELTGSYFKIAQAHLNKAGAQLSAVKVLKIADLPDAQITSQIKETCKSLRIKGGDVVVAIDRQYAILRFLRLPSTDIKELRGMVDLQAVNHIPYAREDVVVDFLSLEQDAEGFTRVLVIVILKEVLFRYWQILTGAGITPTRMTLSSIGIKQWFLSSNKFSSQAVALMDIDDELSEICLCANGKLLTSRHISLGAKQLALGQYDDFIKQMDLTLSSYAKEKLGPAPGGMIVYAAKSEVQELQRKMGEDFSVDVQAIQLSSIAGAVKSLRWPKEITDGDVSLTALTGLALNDDGKSLDFIPPEIKEGQGKTRKQQQLIRMAVLFVLAVGSIGFALSLGFLKQNATLQTLEKKIKDSKKRMATVEGKIEQIKLIQSMTAGRVIFADIIEEVYRILPGSIALINFSLSTGNVLSLQGYTAHGSDINQLQGAMVESAIFDHVNLDYVNKRNTQEGETNYFKLTCQIKTKGSVADEEPR